tara:strand:- start:72 stop:581 length:510 start_codon:yes stop_codon:yes gene_type:complete
MEQNLNNKKDFKNKIIFLYKNNKLKIYSLVTILLIALFSITILKIINEKTNNLMSEKFVKAGLYLSSNNREKSKDLYEEIILSKNKFYSILALNTILEKDLVTDKNKIFQYFKIVEELNKPQEQTDLVIFKKALYLIKISNIKEGNELLKKLIDENSQIKLLAEEILAK